MMTFQIGQVVRLKSGGPAMTITYRYDDETLKCEWWYQAAMQSSNFPPEALVLNA